MVDIWDRLNIACGGYNNLIEDQIFKAAQLIVKATEDKDGVVFTDELALSLGINEEHAELIQYLLASIKMPVLKGEQRGSSCFTYGCSPRGLFVDSMKMAKQFLKEFKKYILKRK